MGMSWEARLTVQERASSCWLELTLDQRGRKSRGAGGHRWVRAGRLGSRSTRCFHLSKTQGIIPTSEVRKLRY